MNELGAVPAFSTTVRHARSTSKPRSSRPVRAADCTSSIAASRPSRAAAKARAYSSGTVAAVNPTQVMSANTAPGCRSLPQRSSSSTSPGRIAPVNLLRWMIVRIAGVLLRRDVRRVGGGQPLVRPSSPSSRAARRTRSWDASGEALADHRERLILHAIQGVGGGRGGRPAPRPTTAPRTAARGRRTTRPRCRDRGPIRSCRRRPARCKGCCCPASIPSPHASCPSAGRGGHLPAGRARHTAACRPAGRRGCAAR